MLGLAQHQHHVSMDPYTFQHVLTALLRQNAPQHIVALLQDRGIWNTNNELLPCDLTNDVHPLLAYSRFDNTPRDLYDRCLPALRLASLFLTEPEYLKFFVNALYGLPTPLPDSEQVLLKLPDHIDWTDLILSTERTLTALARYVRIKWSTPGVEVPYMAICGLDTEFYTPGERPFPFTQNSNAFVELIKDFRELLEGRELSAEDMLRLHFRMAVALVHEFAHVVVLMRFSEADHFLHSETDLVLEDGFSWEKFALDGLTACCNSHYGIGYTPITFERFSVELAAHMRASYGTTAELEKAFPLISGKRKLHLVSLAWVNQWFRNDFWQQVRDQGKDWVPEPDTSGLYMQYRESDNQWLVVCDDQIVLKLSKKLLEQIFMVPRKPFIRRAGKRVADVLRKFSRLLTACAQT